MPATVRDSVLWVEASWGICGTRPAITGGTSKRGRGGTVKRDFESQLMQFSDRALTESIAET